MSGLLIKREPQPQPKDVCYLTVFPCMRALVDPEDYLLLRRFRWRLRMSGSCFYAVRRLHREGKTIEIKLHREIMHTPEGYECHHKNRRTLDCRKRNLENLTPAEHASRRSTPI